MLTETLNLILPQKFSNVKIIKNLNSLTHKAIEISQLEHKFSEPIFIISVEVHTTIIYVFVTMVILVVSILAVGFRNTIIKTYSPEVADNISNNDQEDP